MENKNKIYKKELLYNSNYQPEYVFLTECFLKRNKFNNFDFDHSKQQFEILKHIEPNGYQIYTITFNSPNIIVEGTKEILKIMEKVIKEINEHTTEEKI